MIIHLLYYHTIARLNLEALAALFLDNRLIIYKYLLCTGDLCCRGTRKTADIHK